MKILVTGSAGFIGFSLCLFLLKKKLNVIGVDNLNNYYDVGLKKKRLEILKKYKNFKFFKLDLSNKKILFGCLPARALTVKGTLERAFS